MEDFWLALRLLLLLTVANNPPIAASLLLGVPVDGSPTSDMALSATATGA